MNDTQAVAKVESGSVPATRGSIADSLGMSAQDFVIDRLLLMQATSELVGDEKQKIGDMILNSTNEMIGDSNKKLEIIPLKMFKTWRVMDMTKKPPEFVREEPMTAANEKQDWEFTELDEHGKQAERRRDYSLHFFVLLASDLERLPILVSFRRTSVKAGKALATLLFKQAALKRPIYAKSAILTVAKDKFNTNTYAFWQVGPGQTATPEALAAAREWAESLNGEPPLIEGLKSRVDWSQERDKDERASSGPAAAPVVVGADPVAPGTAPDGPY